MIRALGAWMPGVGCGASCVVRGTAWVAKLQDKVVIDTVTP